jgi:RNA polymerase primary sigma factor
LKQIINKASRDRSLDLYLDEIAKIPLIGREEEASLAKKIHNGSDKALKDLTEANLRFVVSVAKDYQNQGLSLTDLINEGNIGLIKAAKRFDETLGFKFISYAVWWIRQAILQALAEQSRSVRLPLNRVAEANSVRKMAAMLQQQFHRNVSELEIADALEIPEAEARSAVEQFQSDASLDAPFSDTGENALIDIIEEEFVPSPEATLKHGQLRQELEKAFWGWIATPSFTSTKSRRAGLLS